MSNNKTCTVYKATGYAQFSKAGRGNRVWAHRYAFSTSGRNARKTHCIRGHAFDETNTAIQREPNGRTSRACRACRVVRAKAAA